MPNITQIKVGDIIYDIRDSSAGQSSLEWGNILGEINNQTDLQEILDNKFNKTKLETKTDKIVSFEAETDQAIKKLTVGIEPVQDLHGYDNPWPAGGGKNLLNNVGTSQTINGVAFTVNSDGTVKASGTATAYTKLELGTVTLAEGSYYVSGGISSAAYINIVSKTNAYATPVQFSVSSGGETLSVNISISNGTVVNDTFYPMIRLSSVSDTSYAPYSNICPISGWTGANVTRTGKNLLKLPQTAVTTNGITFTPHEDGSITVNGTATGTADFPIVNSSNYLIFGNKSLSISIEVFGVSLSSATINFQNDFYDGNTYLGTIQGNTKTKTYSGSNVICKSSRIRVASGNTFNNLVIKPMMVFGNEVPTEFAPYSGTTLPISWQSEAGTVYGGSLDVTTGALTVTGLYYSNTWGNGGSATVNTNCTRKSFAYTCDDIFLIKGSAKNDLCNMLSWKYNENDVEHFYASGYSGGKLYIACFMPHDTPDTTELQFYLELKPENYITYTLTAAQLTTLLGDNNIWADCGDIEVIIRSGAGELASLDSIDYNNLNNKPVNATSTKDGFMSSFDKIKIDGIENNANNYILPIASSTTLGGIKIGTNLNINNGVASAIDTKYIALTTSITSILTTESISIKQIQSWSTGVLPTKGTDIEAINNISFSTGIYPNFSYDEENEGLIISAGILPELISTTVAIPNITNVGTLPQLISEDKTVTNISVTSQVIVTGISES